MGVHDFDLARWLMGSEVVRVQTEGDCLVFPELKGVGDIDNAVVNLKFANNTVGNIDVSRNAVFGYDVRTEILGSEGALQIGSLQQTSTLVLTRQGITHDTIPGFMARFADAYARKYETSFPAFWKIVCRASLVTTPEKLRPLEWLQLFHWMKFVP